MKITEERLDELQRRFEGYCGRTVSEGNAVTVNYPKWIEVLELVRGYRIGLATEAAPVFKMREWSETVQEAQHDGSIVDETLVRIVPVVLSGATTGSGE